METLQWGRNFIVAEMSPAGGVPPAFLGCFNGAATLSLRKWIVPVVGAVDEAWLQWGRNFIVAEI